MSEGVRVVWTAEKQAEIDRMVRAVALSGVLDWESRITALEKPGQLPVERP